MLEHRVKYLKELFAKVQNPLGAFCCPPKALEDAPWIRRVSTTSRLHVLFHGNSTLRCVESTT